jgi:hypothetical protein
MDLHTAGALEWRKKLLQLALIASFHDQIHGVLALDHRFALNLQPEPGNAWPAQVIEEHRTPVWILGRAPLGRMHMPDDEPRHDSLLFLSRLRGKTLGLRPIEIQRQNSTTR